MARKRGDPQDDVVVEALADGRIVNNAGVATDGQGRVHLLFNETDGAAVLPTRYLAPR